MSFAAGAVKVLGMFDKVDDIIYEPIKLACDALRAPLKMLDARNERVNAEHRQELEKQLKQFEVDLDLDKQRREMLLSVEQRKLDEEINQMILDKDMARREEMVQLEVKYRKEMAQAAADLAKIVANLEVEARKNIIALYTEKEKEYLDLQGQYKKQMFETVKSLRETFPDGSGEDIIREEIKTQLQSIAERSSNFSKLMNTDMTNIFGTIDAIVTDTTALASKYFLPSTPNQTALHANSSRALEQG